VKQTVLLMSLVALLAGVAGYFIAMSLDVGPAPVSQSVTPAVEPPSADDLLGTRRPDFEHDDIEGNRIAASDFDGAPLLLNFWATWCKPCVEEMPMLSDLQQSRSNQGLRIVGIALDDAERARQFAADMGVEYPILVGGVDVVLTGRRFGNRTGMLPFSVLIDSGGTIRWVHLGALERPVLEAELDALN
jgi:peroxiredoxin